MTISFKVIINPRDFPTFTQNSAILMADNWDDWSYKTLFYLYYFDPSGNKHDIGNVKIASIGQQPGRTSANLQTNFHSLDENFFSLGQSDDYYKNIYDLGPNIYIELLSSLNDIVFSPLRINSINNETVFRTSLMRSVSYSSITGQFPRILRGDAPLTAFHFAFNQQENERFSSIQLEFQVIPDTTPSTNLHVLIGRNGVGKTTILNNMVEALINRGTSPVNNAFSASGIYGPIQPQSDYFSSVISISFSAFDPFIPPPNQTDRSMGICYYYVGLKSLISNTHTPNNVRLKELQELRNEFVESLKVCFSLEKKKNLWKHAIIKLESDVNFEEMGLQNLCSLNHNDQRLESYANTISLNLSSGHAIVLLSITKLIEHLEEKSLVLIDEPESHLHPPLLSAYIRAISDILISQNGVAIIATHSPVVLQEVPRSCVTIIGRIRSQFTTNPAPLETFGENVGILTREVFELQVSKTGFHALLSKSAEELDTYDEVLSHYTYQVGMEGRAILRALINLRETSRIPS